MKYAHGFVVHCFITDLSQSSTYATILLTRISANLSRDK